MVDRKQQQRTQPKKKTKSYKGKGGGALENALNQIVKNPVPAQSSEPSQPGTSLLGANSQPTIGVSSGDNGIFSQMFGTSPATQKQQTATEKAQGAIGSKLKELTEFVQQASENKVDKKYLTGLSGEQQKTISFLQENISRLGGSDDNSVIKGLSHYLVQSSLKDLDTKFKDEKLLTQSNISKKLLSEVKGMTTTIGDISAKSIIYQYKYIISNLMFYKFYTNYVDIIDNITLIAAEAVDNSMTVMMKTLQTVNNQYKSLHDSVKLPQNVSIQQQKLMQDLDKQVVSDLSRLRQKQQQLVEQSQKYQDRFVNYSKEQEEEISRNRAEQLKSANQVLGSVMNSLKTIVTNDPPQRIPTSNASTNTAQDKVDMKMIQDKTIEILQAIGIDAGLYDNLKMLFNNPSSSKQDILNAFNHLQQNSPNMFLNMTGLNVSGLGYSTYYNMLKEIILAETETERQKLYQGLRAMVDLDTHISPPAPAPTTTP